MKLKHYEIVQNSDLLTVDIQEVCMSYKTIKEWAYIEHDKDDTRPHYHIYVNFGNSGVSHEEVAKWFNVPPNFVNKIKGRETDMLQYLIHGNESQKHKYQYDPSEVISNFSFQTEIEKSKILGDWKNYSFAQMLKYIDTLPISDKAKSFSQLERLWKLQCQLLTLDSTRDIKVIFVTGPSGTGKTYYAKKLLESLGKDYCISSSNNDPFQDYLGQKGFIFDDIRDTTFEELSDLLKILDNNTGSSVKSRFSNKVFNGDIMILTSCIPLCYWYRKYKYNSLDTLDQLYRRFSLYVEVKEKEILVYNEIGKDGKPCGDCKRYYNEVYDLKKSKKTKQEDVLNIFDKFCVPLNHIQVGHVTLTETFDYDKEIF